MKGVDRAPRVMVMRKVKKRRLFMFSSSQFLIWLNYLWVIQCQNFFKGDEKHVVSSIDGAGNAINRVCYRNPTPQDRVVLNVIYPTKKGPRITQKQLKISRAKEKRADTYRRLVAGNDIDLFELSSGLQA